MGYVLSGEGAWTKVPSQRRTATAQEALRAFVDYLGEYHWPAIRDAAGQPVALPHLLAEAFRMASDQQAHRRLIVTLTDYMETRLHPWDNTDPYDRPSPIYWRHAGQSWARDFERHPSRELLDELVHRYPDPNYCELLRGLESCLSRRTHAEHACLVSLAWGNLR